MPRKYLGWALRERGADRKLASEVRAAQAQPAKPKAEKPAEPKKTKPAPRA